MSKAEQIVREHIKQLSERIDGIIEYELYMADNDCTLSTKEAKELDSRLQDLQSRRVELINILAEIQGVNIEDLVLE